MGSQDGAGRIARSAEPQPPDQARPSGGTEGRNATASPHTWVTLVCPRSGARLAAQVPFFTLPDELLGGMLRRAWTDRPARPAAEEVRCAAGLALVCSCVRELLRAHPLPLALDFSAARLTTGQRSWLLEPAQAGRMEAASFHPEDGLWEQPLLNSFMALHGGTLLHLSGVPLRLVACKGEEERGLWRRSGGCGLPEPGALDLSGLRLTKLGVDCRDFKGLIGMDFGWWTRHLWLWPERLPGALEQLHLLGVCSNWRRFLAWAPQSTTGVALPWLHSLCVTCVEAAEPLSLVCIPLLREFPVSPAFELNASGANVVAHADLFGRVRSVRVAAANEVRLLGGDQDNVVAFVDSLCRAGLQAAELRAMKFVYGPVAQWVHSGGSLLHEVVRELISRYSDRFAVEVDPGEGPEHEARLRRLAWRRWPAPDAPDLPAALAAHERARAWAATVGWPEDCEDRP